MQVCVDRRLGRTGNRAAEEFERMSEINREPKMKRMMSGKRGRARRLRPAIIGAIVGLGVLLAYPAVGQTPPDLVLLFTHDLHSAILPHRVLGRDGRVEIRGGFARIASMIKTEREKSGARVLVVDAGDMVVGNLFFKPRLRKSGYWRPPGTTPWVSEIMNSILDRRAWPGP
jgi:hypothetical protein